MTIAVDMGCKATKTIKLDKSPLLNLAGRTKAHFFEKNRLKSFIKLLTLIRLLNSGYITPAVCFHCQSLTLLFLLYVVTNNLIWVLKAIDILRKSIYSLGQTIYYNWETYVLLIQMTFDLVVTISMHFYEWCQTKDVCLRQVGGGGWGGGWGTRSLLLPK